MKGVKPSASSGSHNSFIKPLASSLVSFSPVNMFKLVVIYVPICDFSLNWSKTFAKVFAASFSKSLWIEWYFCNQAYDSRISWENNCQIFAYYLYCSSNPTTDSEITNPEFSRNFVVVNKIAFGEKIIQVQRRLVKLVLNSWKFACSELVIGSGEQDHCYLSQN